MCVQMSAHADWHSRFLRQTSVPKADAVCHCCPLQSLPHISMFKRLTQRGAGLCPLQSRDSAQLSSSCSSIAQHLGQETNLSHCASLWLCTMNNYNSIVIQQDYGTFWKLVIVLSSQDPTNYKRDVACYKNCRLWKFPFSFVLWPVQCSLDVGSTGCFMHCCQFCKRLAVRQMI
jgi:hypothetical protein